MRLSVARSLASPVPILLVNPIQGRGGCHSPANKRRNAHTLVLKGQKFRGGGWLFCLEICGRARLALPAVIARGEAGLPAEEPREVAGVGIADF